MKNKIRLHAATTGAIFSVILGAICPLDTCAQEAGGTAPRAAPGGRASNADIADALRRALVPPRAEAQPGDPNQFVVPSYTESGGLPASVKIKVEEGPPESIAVGQVKTVPIPGVRRVAIGNQGLLKATVVDDRQIVLIGQAPGSTTMHVWLRSGRQIAYKVQVRTRPDQDMTIDELRSYLGAVPGLRTSMIGDRLVVEGRYPDADTAARVQALNQSFPQILNLVAKSPAGEDELQAVRMVQLDLRILEIKRNALRQLGIKWDATADGPRVATNGVAYTNGRWGYQTPDGMPAVNTSRPIVGYAGLATALASKINLLEQVGDAWTLAEPRLSCQSRGQSNFVAGGEIPIPVQTQQGISVIYKKYGVLVEFTPVADGAGNISTGIKVEVSEPDSRNTNAGFIAFTTNRAETQAFIKAGEPLAIAGLVRQRGSESSNEIPGLGRIPVIGRLFGASDKLGEQTELVILVKPSVIDPTLASQDASIERSEQRAKEMDERIGSQRMETATDRRSFLPSATPASAPRVDKVKSPDVRSPAKEPAPSPESAPAPAPAPAPQTPPRKPIDPIESTRTPDVGERPVAQQRPNLYIMPRF